MTDLLMSAFQESKTLAAEAPVLTGYSGAGSLPGAPALFAASYNGCLGRGGTRAEFGTLKAANSSCLWWRTNYHQ